MILIMILYVTIFIKKMAFSKIVEMDEIDHILHRPDMYILEH